MKNLDILFNKPPIIRRPILVICNPLRKWYIILATGYGILGFLSYGLFIYTKIAHLLCKPLFNVLYKLSLLIAISYVLTLYYAIISCRENDTEKGWKTMTTFSVVFSVLDIVSSCFGIYSLYTIVFIVFKKVTGIYDCSCVKAIFLFICNAFLIYLHLTFAIISIIVNSNVSKYVDEQLKNNIVTII
ncbi:conserved protein, unknown function [Hepatocystis sp. ex Piliocolobus tephrosceles]|nr:conserved protein, unknown function [Hepatocystis sp. ex Piliocolobus tephrosceles]